MLVALWIFCLVPRQMDSSKRTDFFDSVTYILFGENPYLYLSRGFEYRI
jgi:hypothetical protein